MIRRATLLVTGLFGLLVGCSGGPVPETRYYTLRPPTEQTVTANDASGSDGLIVGIDSFVVDPPYDQDRLVYRPGSGSSEVGFYHYHRWASPLGALLATAFAEGLRGTDGIASVEPARSGARYTARLGGRLIYLEEVDLPEGQEVRLVLDLVLRDESGDEIWGARLSESAEVSVETVPEIVAQVQRLVERLLLETRKELAAVLPLP